MHEETKYIPELDFFLLSQHSIHDIPHTGGQNTLVSCDRVSTKYYRNIVHGHREKYAK